MRATSRWSITNGSETNMKHKGFTLIELLVVIAIILILSAIVFASVKDSKDQKAMSDDEYCKQTEVASRTIEQLPVRCLKFYETGIYRDR